MLMRYLYVLDSLLRKILVFSDRQIKLNTFRQCIKPHFIENCSFLLGTRTLSPRKGNNHFQSLQ